MSGGSLPALTSERRSHLDGVVRTALGASLVEKVAGDGNKPAEFEVLPLDQAGRPENGPIGGRMEPRVLRNRKDCTPGEDIRLLHLRLNQMLPDTSDQLPVDGAGGNVFGPRTEAKVARTERRFSVIGTLYLRSGEGGSGRMLRATPGSAWLICERRLVLEEVLRFVAKLCAVSMVCATFGSCADTVSASPWRVGKNKLPRLSSQTQSVEIEHIRITTGWSMPRKRRKR